jgi:Bacterial type III secretion protein (HrpB7)
MTGIKSLRTLVRLKLKRLDGRRAVLQDSRLAMQQAQLAFDAQAACHRHLEQQAQACHAGLCARLQQAQGLRGCDVVTLQHLLRDAQHQATQALQESELALSRVHAAERAMKQADADVKRSEQQLDGVRLRLQQALDAIDRAQEDAQDEEAEETAVARMVAAHRAVGAAAAGEGR